MIDFFYIKSVNKKITIKIDKENRNKNFIITNWTLWNEFDIDETRDKNLRSLPKLSQLGN